MSRDIIVSKNKNQVHGIRVFFIIYIIGLIITSTIYIEIFKHIIFLFFPTFVLTLCLLLYYETWQISFSSKGISKRIFWRKTKIYLYSQLNEVTMMYFLSERSYCIVIKFADGKKIRFRLNDENAIKAKNKLLSHCSIRMVK